MLDQLMRGFEIDGRLIPWGATLDQCCEDNLLLQPGQKLSSRILPCRSVDGIGAVSVKLTAMRSDRPVTQLCYELAPSQAATAEGWLRLFSARFGAPDLVEREELPPGAMLADRVGLYARWGGDVVTMGLSVYGAARAVDHGLAAACLWVTWRTDLAAKPYLEDWRRQNIEVSGITARASQVRTFALAVDLYARSAGSDRAASLALSTPEILDTPSSIAAHLNPRIFALWSSAADACWGVSTKWDTLSFAIGRRVDVTHIELQPAKGGGRSELCIGSWVVWDCYGRKAIKEAAALLAAIPGVEVTQHGGYDC